MVAARVRRVGAAAWGAAPMALLTVFLLLTVVPTWPNLPYPQQDSAWALALNQAVADRLAFGRDVIYPLGPWGNVYAGQYHPATDAMTLSGAALVALAVAAGLCALVRGARRWLLLLLPVLVATVALRDPVFVITPLLLVAVATAASRPLTPSHRWVDAATLLLAVTCGLLTLVKGTFGTQSAVMSGLAALALAPRRRGLAALVLACYAGSIAAFWLGAGQRLGDLPAYIRTMVAVVAGYSEGLAVDGPASDIVAYLSAAAALVALFWRGGAVRRGSLSLAAAVLLTLFLAFKSGFVRHDEHALIAAGTLAMAPLALAGSLRPRPLAAALVVTLAALCFISHHHPGSEWPSWQRGRDRFLLAAAGAWRRATTPDWLPGVFDRYMEQARISMPLPRVEGPSDIYSSGQMMLLANRLEWSPRPALQSVTVLSEVIARADLDHLQGASGRPAVQNVFYRVESEDNRLRATQDGLSWPALLGAFRVEGYDRALETAVLRRRPGALPPAPGSTLTEGAYGVGEAVALPALPGGLAWATLDIQPTLAGRLATFLFRPPLLMITIRYADGAVEQSRLISGLARLGFLLSPRIRTTEDMLSLLVPERRGPRFRPVALTVTGQRGTGWLWEPRFTLRLQRIDIPEQEQVRAMLAPAALRPVQTPLADAGTAEACVIDLMDGRPPPGPATGPAHVRGIVDISGWSVISAGRGEAPERVVIRLTDAAGQAWETVAEPRPRIDVAGHFVNPALSAAGFDARFDASSLQGEYKLAVLGVRAGKSWRCRQSLNMVIEKAE